MKKNINLKDYEYLDTKIEDLEKKLGYDNDKNLMIKELSDYGMIDLFFQDLDDKNIKIDKKKEI